MGDSEKIKHKNDTTRIAFSIHPVKSNRKKEEKGTGNVWLLYAYSMDTV
jgi:hypothetical protein